MARSISKPLFLMMEISTKNIFKILETQRLTNQSLTHCGFDFTLKIATAKQTCRIDYTIKDKMLNLAIQSVSSTEFSIKAIRIQKSIWIKQDESENTLRSEDLNQTRRTIRTDSFMGLKKPTFLSMI